jgi:hypothetical protein
MNLSTAGGVPGHVHRIGMLLLAKSTDVPPQTRIASPGRR